MQRSAPSSTAGALLLLAAFAQEAAAGTGYGYKREDDPLILGVKKLILAARQDDWKVAAAERAKLEWQFQELRDDLGVDLQADFAAALQARSLAALSPQIARLMFYSVAQKLHWNRKEELRRFVPAKSRLEAALFYYEEILAIGVRDFDKKNQRQLHRAILKDFEALRAALGSPGLFGLGSREPDLKGFAQAADAALANLRQAYPSALPETPK